MKSAITVSLVGQARSGPFVYHDGLANAAAEAARLGYDAIEIFPPSADALNAEEINTLVKQHDIAVAAVGTGGGWVIHKQHLCLPDPAARQGACQFIRGIIDVAAGLGAPAIIGSMQGRWGDGVSREQALTWLAEALNELGEHAAAIGQPLLYEPLNRYETNLFNTVADTVAFLKTLTTTNVKILADLFHMNIEEANVADAIRGSKGFIGHVHFVDSNRRAVGMGHTDFVPIVAALREIGYTGYLSAEAFPLPDTATCAWQQIQGINRLLDIANYDSSASAPDTLRETPDDSVPSLAPPDVFDPVIEAYKKDVDRTLIRENLKHTPHDRAVKMDSAIIALDQLRGIAWRQKKG